MMRSLWSFVEKHYVRISVAVVFLSILFLRLIPIGLGDLYSDGAVNSYRAFGWFDWLGGGQSTPIVWFGHIPTWALLSFHDAPPLAFFLQYIFFMFGESTIVARLPFVVAGITSVAVIYFALKKVWGIRWALGAAVVYSVASYSVWAERAVYLEGIESLFILMSVLFGACVLFLPKPLKVHIYIWIVSVAAALMTKYTALFLVPPILLSFVVYRKTLLPLWKHLVTALVVALLVMSPVILYNAKVYDERGHFDAALSSIVGMHPKDFSAISQRSISANPIGNSIGVFKIAFNNISLPLLLVSIAGLLVTIWDVVRTRRWYSFEAWILLNGFCVLGLFAFAGVADRFLPVLVPFIVLFTLFGFRYAYHYFKKVSLRHAFFVVAVIVVVCEFTYALNTNTLRNPVGPSIWLYSPNKIQDLGFNRLEAYIRKHAIVDLPEKVHIRTEDDFSLSNEHTEGKVVVIYDDRISWFSQAWYLQKYLTYYHWPVINTTYLAQNPNFISTLTKTSAKKGYYVYAVHESIMDSHKAAHTGIAAASENLMQGLEKAHVKSVDILNGKGEPAFRVYEMKFK